MATRPATERRDAARVDWPKKFSGADLVAAPGHTLGQARGVAGVLVVPLPGPSIPLLANGSAGLRKPQERQQHSKRRSEPQRKERPLVLRRLRFP